MEKPKPFEAVSLVLVFIFIVCSFYLWLHPPKAPAPGARLRPAAAKP